VFAPSSCHVLVPCTQMPSSASLSLIAEPIVLIPVPEPWRYNVPFWPFPPAVMVAPDTVKLAVELFVQ